MIIKNYDLINYDLVRVVVHVIERRVVLELGLVGADAANDGVLHLTPLAAHVRRFVRVARARHVILVEGNHRERLAVLFHVPTSK